MGSRRRYVAEQEPAQRRTVIQRSEEPGNGVLELQRSAGNKAVAERIEVARDGTAPPETQSKAKTLTLDKLSRPLDLLSVSLKSAASGTGTSGGGQTELHEIVVTAQMDDLAPEIQQALAKGRHLGNGDITMGSTIIHMSDVVISNIQLGSSPSEPYTFTLNFSGVEFKQASSDEGAGTPTKPPT
jgi:hypothetical protein